MLTHGPILPTSVAFPCTLISVSASRHGLASLVSLSPHSAWVLHLTCLMVFPPPLPEAHYQLLDLYKHPKLNIQIKTESTREVCLFWVWVPSFSIIFSGTGE